MAMCVATGLRRIAGLLVVGMALAALTSGTAFAVGSLSPGSKALAPGSSCVGDPNDMRRNHMRYLNHDRDRAVQRGNRSINHSLVGCIDCHAGREASGTPIPVSDKGQFCASCHTYTGIRINCFQCHSQVPEER